MQNKIYIGNLDYGISEGDLGKHFEMFGVIKHIKIPVNKDTGQARGFAFITFDRQHSAEEALSMNATELFGRVIRVNMAREN